MRQLFQSGLVALLAALLVTATLSGCNTTGTAPTPQAIVYQTLATTKAVVDNAEKFYGAEVVQGRVAVARQKEIDARIVEFHTAFGLAVQLAKKDFTAITPSTVQELADALVLLINNQN